MTSLTAEQIAELLDLPLWRGRQILAWALERGATEFSQMTDLPKQLRAELPAHLAVLSSRVQETVKSPDGTTKLLVLLEDDEPVECVLIPEGRRLTLCVSSQVGCPAGCAFCASGLLGFTRNLKAHEIHEQVLHAARIAGDRRITNLVVMGMGEPLLNYENLVAAIRRLSLGSRRITVSTVGLPDRIRRLANEGVPVNLAVSLHAPDDAIRNRLVPVNRRFGIDEVVAAARYYADETGRDVTFEYILIAGENASEADADRLATRIGRGHLNVNLIPMNPVEGLPYRPPSKWEVDAFLARLRARGIPAHVRRPRGRRIDAACGQLRLRRKRGARPENEPRPRRK